MLVEKAYVVTVRFLRFLLASLFPALLFVTKAGAGLFQLVVTEFVFSKIINYATLRAAQVKAKVGIDAVRQDLKL